MTSATAWCRPNERKVYAGDGGNRPCVDSRFETSAEIRSITLLVWNVRSALVTEGHVQAECPRTIVGREHAIGIGGRIGERALVEQVARPDRGFQTDRADPHIG